MLKAKPYHGLLAHLEDALRVFQHYYPGIEPGLKNLCRRFEVSETEMRFYHALGVFGHDFGKATAPWQRYIRNEGKRITHSLFSFAALWEMVAQWDDPVENRLARNMLLAVLAHHSMLHHRAYSSTMNLGTMFLPAADVNQMVKRFQELEPSAANMPEVTLNEEDTTWITAEIVDRIHLLRDYIYEDIPRKERLIEKQVYGLFLRTICLCDNASSKISAELYKNRQLTSKSAPSVTSRHLQNELRQWLPDTSILFRNVPVFKTPNRMQQKLLNSLHPNLILKAGCGEGKTAAALMFARHFIETGQAERVIFTMPTKFTSNSMYYDFIGDKYNLPSELVGLYHSEAERILTGIGQQAEEEKDTHLEDSLFLNTFYQLPVTISTIDHLLYSLLHCYKYADRAFGNISRSVVIFDEVHYYDRTLLQKIGQSLHVLRKLDIPHMLMTATLPEVIEKKLHGYPSVCSDGKSEDQKRLKQPFKIEKIDEPLIHKEKGMSAQALKVIDSNKAYRQMIVVNQVEKAKRIYQELRVRYPEANIVCYHSEFRPNDRAMKEKVIKALFSTEHNEDYDQLLSTYNYKTNTQQAILVTTQVSELSLDISAEVMLTELAPIDSLSQRGGRLHRKGEAVTKEKCGCAVCQQSIVPSDYEYKQYVFRLDQENPYDYLPYVVPQEGQGGNASIESDNILDITWETLGEVYSFPAVTNWVNQVYQQVIPEEFQLSDHRMKEYIDEDIIFGRKVQERFGHEDEENSQGSFQVREGILKTYTVVPKQFEEIIHEQIYEIDHIRNRQQKAKLYEAIMDNSVQINEWKYKKALRKNTIKFINRFENLSIPILKLDYDGQGEGINFQTLKDRENELDAHQHLINPIL